MLRNCLAAAVRHLARNRVYTLISVLGLAVGLCATLLAALVIHSQFGRDHFITGYDRIYAIASHITPPGHPTVHYASTVPFVGPQLALRFREIEALTRLQRETVTLSRGTQAAHEPVYWADPNAFQVLPLPAVAGDLRSALERPDAVVLSRSIARRYFGREAPVGDTLLLKVSGSEQTHALLVTAVIEDLPPNGTHLTAGVFVSSLAPWTQLHQQESVALEDARPQLGVGTQTYLKFRSPGTAVSALLTMPDLARVLFSGLPRGWDLRLSLVRIDRLTTDAQLNPAFGGRALMLGIAGMGTLLIASVNFVNLLIVRSVRRAREVSIRKLAGATRRVLVGQFLAEATVLVIVAALIALSLAEMFLPQVNAFVSADSTFKYWREPTLLLALGTAVLLLGTIAGFYPALTLAAAHLARGLAGTGGVAYKVGAMRQSMVCAQFAVLIGLLVAAAVVYQQRTFATREALRVDTEQVLLIRAACNGAFVAQVRALAGVRAVGCSSSVLVDHTGVNVMLVKDRFGGQQPLYPIFVQPSLLDLYRIKSVAGRPPGSSAGTYYLLNETAARQLGFARPSAAIGYTVPAYELGPVPVTGVVADFSLDSVEHKIEAQGLVVTAQDKHFDLINVKLTGRAIPQTLRAIDQLQRSTGLKGPIDRFFLDQHIQLMYLAVLREAQLFAAFAAVAIVLACLGLLGLSASIAERRTHEIGIRKALGADTHAIVRLLLGQFAMPVLWANLIAWPLTAYAMQQWLNEFAYHVQLAAWLFPVAGLLVLVIALLTVSAQTILSARTRPVIALRYE